MRKPTSGFRKCYFVKSGNCLSFLDFRLCTSSCKLSLSSNSRFEILTNFKGTVSSELCMRVTWPHAYEYIKPWTLTAVQNGDFLILKTKSTGLQQGPPVARLFYWSKNIHPIKWTVNQIRLAWKWYQWIGLIRIDDAELLTNLNISLYFLTRLQSY